MSNGDLTMVMVGDVYVQRPDPDSAFEANHKLLRDADITFGNLETVFADTKYLDPDDHDHHPRSDERVVPAYLRAGFNVLNVANNPSMYHGRPAFLRSMEVLDEAGIVRGGGGRNLEEARKPAIIERNGLKVAFVCRTAVCPEYAAATETRGGVARFPVRTAYEGFSRILDVPGSPAIVHTVTDPKYVEEVGEDIRKAKEQADLVISSWHWGVSPATGGTSEMADYQVEMGHYSIDAGADMVVGHHPHVLQPIEMYKGKPILYSIGNYVHDMDSMSEYQLLTMLLRCTVRGGKIAKLSFVPGRIDGNGPPEFHSPADAMDVVNYMNDISGPYGTLFEVGEDEVSVVLDRVGPKRSIKPFKWRRAAGL